MSNLSLSRLSKRYRDTVAVDDITLHVGRGESVALLGPSGCGKTTTLRMLAGLIAPDQGSISLDGAEITLMPAHRRNMGYVFQSYALFPHLTVERNVGFGLEERGVSREERRRRVAEALELVRLTGLEDRRPRELSGGQQQRVALARALVIRPAVLLLDESLSNLDAKLREAMRREIRDIQRSLAITTIFVTHDQVEALTMCDRVAVMNCGRIEQVAGPEEIYERPANRFVAGFVGRANVLPVQRVGDGLTLWGQRLSIGDASGGEVDLFVRPQRIAILPVSEPTGDEVIRVVGEIKQRIFIGERVELVIGGRDGELVADLPSGLRTPEAGVEVAAVWAKSDALIFPREAA